MSFKPEPLENFLEFVTYDFTNPMPDSEHGPWKVTAKDVIDGKINFDSARRTTQEAFDKLLTNKSRPKIGDVLLTKDGTLGRLAVVACENLCVNQSVAVLRPNNRILSDFLYYLLSSPEYQRRMIGDADGTVIKHIYITRVGKMEVTIPDIQTQRILLLQLRTIDDKIELNRQINQTLEQIAQAIFKSWFVDFDPVKAKIWANENGHDPERAAMCALAGLPYADDALDHLSPEQQQQLATTAALFPATLEESEFGEIPSGWQVSPIEKHVTIKHGFAFKGEHFSDSETDNILLTPGNFRIGGGFKFDKLKHYDGPIPSDYVLAKHDLLITMTDLSKQADTLGFPALVPSVPGKKFLHNQRLGKVLPKHGSLLNYYFYCLFCTDRYRNEIVGGATGSTVKHTAPIKIGSVKHVFNGSLERTFNDLVSPMFSEIDNCFNEILALTQLRDTLLPKLLSGELSVADLPEVAAN